MIPKLSPERGLEPNIQAFLAALRDGGFSGDILTDYANRLVNATDNSIYQLIPQAVLAPRNETDIATTMHLMGQERFREITLTPRGGGTGTNGQALNHSLILDCSKYMRSIVALDAEAMRVTVEPGVILDQLNAMLKPHGLFFPPTLSPSNRATLGGMVATDACGKGSRIYGKTSDYVEALTLYLPSGERWEVEHYPDASPPQLATESQPKAILSCLQDIAQNHRQEIEANIPKLSRQFSGYNLPGIIRDGKLSPTNIIAGSEGTLGVIAAITLRVIPIPSHRRLVALCYKAFDTTLRDAQHLLSFDPLAVETFDGTVFQIARGDAVWHRVCDFMPTGNEADKVGGCNLVEFVGEDETAVEAEAQKLSNNAGNAFHVAIAREPDAIAGLWELRKRGVGLLGNMEGDKQPVAFVEDTAVPPEQLADYIAEYVTLLEGEGVDYGMFGHVDTGCLHVRPALNLRTKEDEGRIRRISDQVVALVKRYGGLMWGEHGKGYRAEFTPEFIGETLYGCLRDIKAAFDPYNQLNPGKIATAAGTKLALSRIDAVPLRGHFDQDIQPEAHDLFPKSTACNGNGTCFNYLPEDTMCPSYKATGDRRYSPKGRAGLMREWLRQLALNDYDITSAPSNKGCKPSPKRDPEEDFSHAVYDSMKECLACKACAGQCPIKVDIPDMRARFFEHYHTRYARPLRDYLIRYSEELGQLSANAPRLFGALQSALPMQRLGMVHVPKPSAPSLSRMLKGAHGARWLDSGTTPEAMPDVIDRAVVLVQDAYTSFYDAPVVRDIALLLGALDFRVLVADFKPNGKSRHVKGFLQAFKQVAAKNDAYLRQIAAWNLPMIGVDAATTLTYRQEYPQMLEDVGAYQLQMLQEWLITAIESGQLEKWKGTVDGEYFLFSHCTEKTSLPDAPEQWQRIFAHFGATLTPVATGCCGMAGTYGHEVEHQETSQTLYAMSWAEPIAKAGSKAAVTGYSCRCQVERFDGLRPLHPAQILLGALSK